ncbi:MAG: RNA 2',3'-cyclic phosphodiesterase [Gemmatimonadetes bacterium]|nr:RNA 2',3'-cyclic phosphodiesterase [Gemmatimonadota bacterium]
MRLFAAVPITDAAAGELQAVLAELGREAWPVRWVRPEGLHLTLKFFGETDPDRAGSIAGMLERAVGRTGPVACAAEGLGTFPAHGSARVLWAGYHGEPALELLAHRIEEGAVALGFPVEGRPFRAHVTLGRTREGSRLPVAAVARLDGRPLLESFTAGRVVLYQSTPGPGGSRYDPLATFPLDG